MFKPPCSIKVCRSRLGGCLNELAKLLLPVEHVFGDVAIRPSKLFKEFQNPFEFLCLLLHCINCGETSKFV